MVDFGRTIIDKGPTMKIFLTGGAGNIGSRAARTLLETCHQVTVKLLTEGLHSELRGTNVKVTVIFPGATETNIDQNSGLASIGDPEASSMKALPASEAAEIIVGAIEKDKYSVLVGSDAKMMNLL